MYNHIYNSDFGITIHTSVTIVGPPSVPYTIHDDVLVVDVLACRGQCCPKLVSVVTLSLISYWVLSRSQEKASGSPPGEGNKRYKQIWRLSSLLLHD